MTTPTFKSNRRNADLIDRLERVLDLVQSTLRREDRDVPVEAGASTAGHVRRMPTDANVSIQIRNSL